MKKSKFKLSFTLKQHTPMIHFQADQDGATLRATELKPKLDRFIIEKHGGWSEIPREWKIGADKAKHEALDYKVKIVAKNVHLKPIAKKDKIPMFFGAMGDDYSLQPKCLSFTKKMIMVDFFSFHSSLRMKIENLFPKFLAETNFGTRQNKGYGSFFLQQSDYPDSIGANFENIPYLYFSKNRIDGNQTIKLEFTDIMNIISYYFQRLKSGINFSNEYQHSFLKIYLDDQNLNYEWEKRWLKENFFGVPSSESTKKYARSMLGVVGNYTFKKHSDGDYVVRSKTVVTVKNEEIQRFKSPITFKPIILRNEIRVYIFTSEVPSELLSKTFKFTGNGTTKFLDTPSTAISITQLVEAYNRSLGNTFTASTYTGNPSYSVTINPINK